MRVPVMSVALQFWGQISLSGMLQALEQLSKPLAISAAVTHSLTWVYPSDMPR